MTSSVKIDWDNPEKTILRYTYYGNWHWDDFLDILETGRSMMAEVRHEVCILNDMREMDALPPNFINTVRNIITSRPSNTGLAVFLTTNAYFKVIYKVLSQLLEDVPTRYVLVTSEEEAYMLFSKWASSQDSSDT